MRYFPTVMIAGLVCSQFLCPGVGAPSAKPAASIVQLKAIYIRLFRVAQEPDQEGVLAFLQDQTTPDWAAVDSKGNRDSRAEQIQVTQDVVAGRASSTPPMGKISYQIDKIIVHGDTEIVRYYQQIISKEPDVTGRYGPRGKLHTLVTLVRHRDTWVQTAAGWRWKLTEDGYPELRVDGELQDE